MNKSISIMASTSFEYVPFTHTGSFTGTVSGTTYSGYSLKLGTSTSNVYNTVEGEYPILLALKTQPAQVVAGTSNSSSYTHTIYYSSIQGSFWANFLEDALIFSEVFDGTITMNLDIEIGYDSEGGFVSNPGISSKSITATYSSGTWSSSTSSSFNVSSKAGSYGYVKSISITSVNGVSTT